jgi:uncharacterized C2H2 Zn-finger protein
MSMTPKANAKEVESQLVQGTINPAAAGVGVENVTATGESRVSDGDERLKADTAQQLAHSVGDAVQYACSACRYQAGSPIAIRHHVLTRHPEAAFACSLCQFLAADRVSLNEHINRRHNNRAAMHRRAKETRDEAPAAEDVGDLVFSSNHDEDNIIPTDDEENSAEQEDNDHAAKSCIQETSNGGEQPVKEEVDLQLSVATKDSKVRRRIRAAAKSLAASLQCPRCPFRAIRRAGLRRHLLDEHGETATKRRRRCEECDYECGLASSMRQHRLSVHGGVRYPCEQCAYLAYSPETLKEHIRKVN